MKAVSKGWALLYYAFLFDQSATAFAETKGLRRAARKAGTPPPSLVDVKYGAVPSNAMRVADRIVGNYLEQTPVRLNTY